jgi:hypothetical protein
MSGLLDYAKKTRDELAKGLLGIDPEYDQPAMAAIGGLLTGNLKDAAHISKLRLANFLSNGKNEEYNQIFPNTQPIDPVNAGLGFAPLGITAWHGSPHAFDKFDMSKIGTGEGAQAYGHGLYFAEHPEVAKSYGLVDVGKNRGFKSVTYNGETIEVGNGNSNLLFDISQQGRKPVINRLEEQALRLEKNYPQMAQKLREKIDFAKTVNPDNIQINGGNLYKVDIPDEIMPRMLDWDKPLSQQSPDVRAALTPYVDEVLNSGNYPISDIGKNRINNFVSGDGTAGGLHQTLEHYFGTQQAASKELANKGITGIKYLDSGSRGAGQGSSNYVLFDDQLPKILERNGKPIK